MAVCCTAWATTWTKVDFSLVRSCGIHLRAVLKQVLKLLFQIHIHNLLLLKITTTSLRVQWGKCITSLNMLLHFISSCNVLWQHRCIWHVPSATWCFWLALASITDIILIYTVGVEMRCHMHTIYLICKLFHKLVMSKPQKRILVISRKPNHITIFIIFIFITSIDPYHSYMG